jgi:hypothetical protein
MVFNDALWQLCLLRKYRERVAYITLEIRRAHVATYLTQVLSGKHTHAGYVTISRWRCIFGALIGEYYFCTIECTDMEHVKAAEGRHVEEKL